MIKNYSTNFNKNVEIIEICLFFLLKLNYFKRSNSMAWNARKNIVYAKNVNIFETSTYR